MVGLSSEALRSQFIEYQTLSGGYCEHKEALVNDVKTEIYAYLFEDVPYAIQLENDGFFLLERIEND